MNKKLILQICIIILLINYLFGCIGWDNEKTGTEQINDIYSISIDQNNFTGNYTIYLPIVIKENGDVAKIMDNLEITKGKGEFKFIDTEYGKAVEINSNQSLNLQASLHETRKEVDHPGNPYREKYFCWNNGLSLYENLSVPNFLEIEEATAKIADVWIYFNFTEENIIQSSIELNIDFERDLEWDPNYSGGIVGGGLVIDNLNVKLVKKGWQKIELQRTPSAVH